MNLTSLMQLKDTNLPVEQELNNWFSQGSVVEIYKQYILLDIDQNGVLSREEFSKFESLYSSLPVVVLEELILYISFL